MISIIVVDQFKNTSPYVHYDMSYEQFGRLWSSFLRTDGAQANRPFRSVDEMFRELIKFTINDVAGISLSPVGKVYKLHKTNNVVEFVYSKDGEAPRWRRIDIVEGGEKEGYLCGYDIEDSFKFKKFLFSKIVGRKLVGSINAKKIKN